MSQLVRDLHVSGLQYVGESVAQNLPVNVGKYKRYSIPYNPNRHCLGYIEGPAASLVANTRNDRGYVTELWKNVENSADFQEGMKNAIIVGELDHPEERVDYSLANGAVVLTDWEIREDEGILWARFAILDNQRGHDLLAYVKFGSILGVSSRGLGDEIVRDGRTLIDPDTYEFYCFDVVAFPAAEVARQGYVAPEALKEAKSVPEAFSDRVMNEASKCSNRERLIELKNVVESTSVSDKKMLVDAITDKLSSLPESAGDERTTGEDDDEKEIILGNLQKELDGKNAEIASLAEKLKMRSENARYFRRVVQEQCKKIEDLEDAVTGGLESTDSIAKDYETLKQENESLQKTLRSTIRKHSVETRKLEAEVATLTQTNRKIIRESKQTAHVATCLENKVSASEKAKKAEISKIVSESRAFSAQVESKLADANRRIEELETENRQLAAQLRTAVNESRQAREAISRARTESESVVSRKNLKIKALKEQLDAATKVVDETQQAKDVAESKVIELEQKFKSEETKSKNLAVEYVKKASAAAGICYEAVMAQMSENFTRKEADTVIAKLSEKQQRFDSLPINVQPISARIVEQKARGNAGDADSFVARALKHS